MTSLPDGSLRIVRRLAALHPGETPSRLKRAVLDGQVTVNGTVADDPGRVVTEADAVAWDPNRKVRRHVDTSLTVLHEDADSIAVVKPAGLLTHPTEAKEKDTLLSRVSAYVARREKGRPYVSVVHRLDKETSGVLVFARSRKGLVTLQAQLKSHAMDRTYLAVVEGDLRGDHGTFDWAIVEEEGERRKHVARDGEVGQQAVTTWRIVERLGVATLVEARLKTGRTHQIRIHFAHAGHPLVGDAVYRHPSRPPFPLAFRRQALHAGRLGWEAPSGEKVAVSAPPPKDFEDLLAALRKRASHPGGTVPARVAPSAERTKAAGAPREELRRPVSRPPSGRGATRGR